MQTVHGTASTSGGYEGFFPIAFTKKCYYCNTAATDGVFDRVLTVCAVNKTMFKIDRAYIGCRSWLLFAIGF